jgi:hypothetical protein
MRISHPTLKRTFFCVIAVVTAHCVSTRPPAADIDPCSLLTSDEVAAVQGATPREAKGSVHSNGGVRVAQCFFSLPEYANSVSIEVTTPERRHGSARSLWNERFALRDDGDEERAEGGLKSTPETHSVTVPGVGTAARWTGNRVSGGLYVLTPAAILRISVGGPGDAATKIARAKQLALKAIPRLR